MHLSFVNLRVLIILLISSLLFSSAKCVIYEADIKLHMEMEKYNRFEGISKDFKQGVINTFNLLWIGNGCDSDHVLGYYQSASTDNLLKSDMKLFTNKILFLRPGVVTNDRLCAS